MIKKTIYYIEIEKEKKILGKMIDSNEKYDKILKQSEKIDSLINKRIEEGYI